MLSRDVINFTWMPLLTNSKEEFTNTFPWNIANAEKQSLVRPCAGRVVAGLAWVVVAAAAASPCSYRQPASWRRPPSEPCWPNAIGYLPTRYSVQADVLSLPPAWPRLASPRTLYPLWLLNYGSPQSQIYIEKANKTHPSHKIWINHCESLIIS